MDSKRTWPCCLCGKEIKAGEFAFLFTEESLLATPCPECGKKISEEESELARKEREEHPEWFGPPGGYDN